MREGNSRRGGYGNGNRSRGGGGNWRGPRGRNGNGGGRQGRSGGRSYNNRRNGHSSHTSGNLRERIAVESGYLVIIDQFMLANPQMQKEIIALIDADPSQKDEVIKKYGGIVIEVAPGNYKILRNPYTSRIVIHSSEGDEVDLDEALANATTDCGKVLVDTRCLAMIDRELLDDTELMEKYQQLWFSDQEKTCRDLLRDNGGAVRYGFEKFGDELKVSLVPNENTICIFAENAKKTEITEDIEQAA